MIATPCRVNGSYHAIQPDQVALMQDLQKHKLLLPVYQALNLMPWLHFLIDKMIATVFIRYADLPLKGLFVRVGNCATCGRYVNSSQPCCVLTLASVETVRRHTLTLATLAR